MSSIKYEFRYMPLIGKLSGESMLQQTEQAINEIAEIVNENVAQADIINTLAQDANNNSVEALEKANEALETSGRVYLKETRAVDLDNYCESQLIYVNNTASRNLPVAHKGFLEVKTNDDKTQATQVFVDDVDKIIYIRTGEVTAQPVGDVINYVASYGDWVEIPTIDLLNSLYLPLSGGTLTGVVNGVTPPNGDNSTKIATTEFVNATAQQADWNVTDTTSKAFIKNKPTNLVAIGNNPHVTLNRLHKDDNGGYPVYFLMHELVRYDPDNITYPNYGNYGFNGIVFSEIRAGNDRDQFLAFAKISLGLENASLYSSSSHYSPVVIKDETNSKYYWAMQINGSRQMVYMLGAFTANPLNTAIPAVDTAGTLPEGWSLVHTAKPYPFDNTHVASADKDGQGNVIDTTYAKKSDLSSAAPTGVVQAFAGRTTPQGWLLCDGSAVSRTNYAALYAVIGTTYGAGNGSTTFNLPNLTDKFIQGSGTVGTVKAAGLPNITGGLFRSGAAGTTGLFDNANGSFSGNASRRYAVNNTNAQYDGMISTISFDASRSSSVYGNSTTVQPPALTMRYIIKY